MASLATDNKAQSWSKVAAAKGKGKGNENGKAAAESGKGKSKGKSKGQGQGEFSYHVGVRANVTTALGESFTARIYTHDVATGLLVFGAYNAVQCSAV